MAQKKYASLSTLQTLVTNIKNLFATKSDLNTGLSGKADTGHKHSISDTTNLQSTLDGKVPTTRTINNKPLSANITLSASDVGAAPSSVQTTLNTVSDTLNAHTENDDIHFSATERTKLSGIAAGAQVNTITGVKGNSESSYRTGNVNITKANIGLGNVDNTSDANKPISTAQQLAFDELNDAIDTHTENDDIHVTTTNKTNWNAAHTHSTSAHARTDATKVSDSSTNGNILINGTETTVYSHPNSGAAAGTYKSVTVNAQGHVTGGSNPTTLAGYGITDAEAKGTASSAVSTHNTSTSAHGDIRTAITELTTKLNNFLDVDDTTTDQLSELLTLIENNATDIESITSGKVNVSDIVNNLTTNVTNKPLSAAQGVAIKSLIDALDLALDTHDGNTTKHITSTERTNWNTAYTHSQAAHAPSNAQANQNAFSNIAVSGQTTVAADTATDTVTFAGSNVSITTDATNDKVTFTVANGTTSAKGVVQLTNSTSSTSTTTAATPNSVKSAYDLANTAKTKADSAYTLAEGKVDSLSDLGITATATELNYMDGVTSNVQLQLDEMADSLSDKLSSDDFARNITSSANTVGQFAKVAYGAGKFVAIPYTYASDTSKFAYSSDGEIWAFVNAPSTSVQASWKDIIYADGKFVVIGNANGTTSANYSAVSTDGINWTVGNFPTGGTPYSIAYGNGRFVVVGSNTVSAHSTDGLNWTRVLLPSSCQAMIVAFGNGKFVAPNPNGYVCAYSTDGSSWTMGDIIASEFSRITFNNGRFVSVGNKSIQYSDDGINWTSVTPPMSANWYALTSGEGYYIALGYRKSDFIYSADGATWQIATAPVSDYWCDVEYGNGKFIAVTEGGQNFLTISFTKNEFGLAYESDIENLRNSFPDVYTKADQKWNLIYDSGEIPEIVNSISGIDVSGYNNIQVLVRCYNDGDSVGSRNGSAIFTCENGKTYQFPVWTSMFSSSINTVSTMATFNLVDGWLVCPYASRAIADIDVFTETEGGTAGNFALTGSGMLKCTSPLSTLTISNLDQNKNYYFGMGSRVIVWGWNG